MSLAASFITAAIMKEAKVLQGKCAESILQFLMLILGLTLCSTRSQDNGKTWSALKPIEEPETEKDCKAYGIEKTESDAKQSHDGYQLLVGDRIFLFYGWNRGSQPPLGEPLPRTDMQLDEGFWMRWSDDYGKSFEGGRVVIPVGLTYIILKQLDDSTLRCVEQKLIV